LRRPRGGNHCIWPGKRGVLVRVGLTKKRLNGRGVLHLDEGGIIRGKRDQTPGLVGEVIWWGGTATTCPTFFRKPKTGLFDGKRKGDKGRLTVTAENSIRRRALFPTEIVGKSDHARPHARGNEGPIKISFPCTEGSLDIN